MLYIHYFFFVFLFFPPRCISFHPYIRIRASFYSPSVYKHATSYIAAVKKSCKCQFMCSQFYRDKKKYIDVTRKKHFTWTGLRYFFIFSFKFLHYDTHICELFGTFKMLKCRCFVDLGCKTWSTWHMKAWKKYLRKKGKLRLCFAVCSYRSVRNDISLGRACTEQVHEGHSLFVGAK